MKRIIINADDYGLCDSVSKGIIDCYNKGLVSDFSFIINPDSFHHSLKLIKENNIKSCGIHFNITMGNTAFSPKAFISDNNGHYYPVKRHLMNYAAGNLKPEIVYEELKMQYDLLVHEGIHITHFDTHQNIHILPPVYKAIKQLSNEHGNIPIRIPQEKLDISYRYKISNLKRILIFNFFSLLIKSQSKNGTPVKAIGGDFFNNPNPVKVLDNICKQIPSNSYNLFELAVHPGYYSDDILKYDPYAREREIELSHLLVPDNYFKKNNIQLCNFEEIFG